MSQALAFQLGLKIRKINVRVQKINATTLKTNEIVDSIFCVLDKDDRERFFEERFLLADIKLNVMLGILFLIMSNINVDFQAWDK